MLERFRSGSPLAELTPVARAEELAEAAELTRECQVSGDIMGYLADFCEAARDPKLVRLGPSPRAMLQWMRAAQALAAVRGRDYVIPDDVKELAVPVLAHRLILRGWNEESNAGELVEQLKNSVPAPTEERT